VKSFGRLITLVAAILGVFIVYRAAPVISEMLVGHSLKQNSLPAPDVLGTQAEKVLGKIPGEWTLVSSEGKQVPFESFRGKVVLLNLWATWCGPCVMEMPGILQLQQELSKEGIQFVLLSMEELKPTNAFIRSKGWTGDFYVAPEGPPMGLVTNV